MHHHLMCLSMNPVFNWSSTMKYVECRNVLEICNRTFPGSYLFLGSCCLTKHKGRPGRAIELFVPQLSLVLYQLANQPAQQSSQAFTLCLNWFPGLSVFCFSFVLLLFCYLVCIIHPALPLLCNILNAYRRVKTGRPGNEATLCSIALTKVKSFAVYGTWSNVLWRQVQWQLQGWR